LPFSEAWVMSNFMEPPPEQFYQIPKTLSSTIFMLAFFPEMWYAV